MIYTYPFYLIAIPIVIALISGAACVYFARKSFPMWTSIVAFKLSAISGAMIAPGIIIDKVELDEESLCSSGGLWWSPTVKEFTFSEVSSITVITAKDRKGKDYELWLLSRHDGRTSSIKPGTLWKMNSQEIVAFLREKGLQVDWKSSQ